MDINVDEKTCLNIKESLRLEWLDTNGLGGYASSSILNCHTRRYHGLLVSNLTTPTGRFVLLSKFEESLLIKDSELFLSFHKYPGVFSPLGFKYLRRFQDRIAPHFVYQLGNTVIHKTIMMPYGENGVMVKYSCQRSDERLTLRLKPFLAFRDHHALSKENLSLQVRTFKVHNGFKIQPYDGMPSLFIQTDRHAAFYPSPVWYRNFEYMIEEERGFDYHEDLFQPGILEIALKEGEDVIVTASTREFSGITKKWLTEETRRREGHAQAAATSKQFKNPADQEIMGVLQKAAKAFLIHQPVKNSPGRATVVAGYHWFADWGRDTLISLPGLAFCTNETDHAIAVLKEFGKHEKDGLLPNFFAVSKKDHAYNAADCSLWYFWAVQQMLRQTGDLKTVREDIWPVLIRIFKRYKEGTSHNIFMNGQGLIHAGGASTQLTWMDAIANGKPVTPRGGYAVDLNALWYNAICFIDELADKFEQDKFRCGELIEKSRKAFNETFWIENGAYLGDVFQEGVLDAAVRPNQILAVSLPYSPLDTMRSRGVVEKVLKELLTPYGLRTLSPRDKAYKGRYEGDSMERDSAYHQGTIWPWLIGHFGEAYLKVADNKKEVGEFLLREMRKSLQEHLMSAGLGYISEVFDGDPPHRPNGCIAQAWSVAEAIRLYFILNQKRF